MRKSLVATAALGLALATAPAYAAPARKPNVIVILADDLGYGDTGVYGSTFVKTPNIDALAADGVRFTQGYVSHPVCAPSRAALLTGRYQTRFGYEFNPVGRDRTSGVSLDETFIGEVMQKAGYRTGMVGKWHLGESGGYHPVARGFDEFFGTTAGANAFIIDTKPGDEFHTPRGAEGSYGTVEGGAGLGDGPEIEQMVRLRERAPITRGREVVEDYGHVGLTLRDHPLAFVRKDLARDRYVSMAEAMAAKVAAAGFAPRDVIVTFPDSLGPDDVAALRAAFPQARLIPQENRGRDVLPFLAALAIAKAEGYGVFCKLHSKRSPHLANGAAAGQAMIDAVLTGRASAFDSDPKLGLLAPASTRQRLGENAAMVNNAASVKRLAELLGGLVYEDRSSFPGGSMFWGRRRPSTGCLRRLPGRCWAERW